MPRLVVDSWLHVPQAWRQGRTGYPLVDAGMRELWSTGWIHNRIRVVCASFMVKNLLLPWQVSWCCLRLCLAFCSGFAYGSCPGQTWQSA